MKKILLIIFLLSNSLIFGQHDFENKEYLDIISSYMTPKQGIVKRGGKVRIENSPVSQIIIQFETPDTLSLIDFKDGYWAVRWENSLGYISELYIESTSITESLKDSIIKERNYEKATNNALLKFDDQIDSLRKKLDKEIQVIDEKKYSLEKNQRRRKLENIKNLPIPIQWELLIQGGGCLTGGEYCRNEKSDYKAGIMAKDSSWIFFLRQPKEKISTFLVSIIGDTTGTTVHTCPFLPSKAGELAIYGLQYIYNINWYDLSNEYAKYKNIEINGFETSHQAILWGIISDPKRLKRMTDNWNSKIKKKI